VRASPPPRARPLRALALADEPPHAPLAELVGAHAPELILVLGDLEPAWTEGLAELGLPKLGVAGNHDAPGRLEALGVEDLHLRQTELGGLSFSGFAGSPRYSQDGSNEWTEAEAEAMLAGLPAADVLLTHSPPAGVNDEPEDRAHRGSAALREWVERAQPAWLLHGHTLPDPVRSVQRLGSTRVVHVRGAVPLDLTLDSP
jgi:Icc-related predicted phosphoesterase